ncbi:hypothetical protein [Helicobacter bizzozeronii]|uniref:hypothetical protein n=1 Tax=Helicobacter bizzozeronii TaxID=56877 RepID=UPI001F35F0D1|nr:hypothetical protein [Helicobacter bizzozeronii]
MQAENYKKADLLVISDGDFGRLDSNLEQQMRQKRQDENRFYLLGVNGNSGTKRTACCVSSVTIWGVIDPTCVKPLS